MVDKLENILVEHDYNNITIVDPNKVVSPDGKVKERYVKQEDLVMYVNLECKVLPRTKLAVGINNDNNLQNISIASINFIKPNNKTKLDNSYTDELTGKDTLQGKGINQVKLGEPYKDNNSNNYFLNQSLLSNGKVETINNGLLGITNINITQGLDFLPVFSIQLEDIKGRAMFEAGDNSPYAAFFNQPYPLFELTLKGYYGKAVKLKLMLQTFTSSYVPATGNFVIDLKFYTYKYTLLSEVVTGYLLSLPHMYQTRVKIQTQSGGPSKTSNVSNSTIELGYEKIKEMYSEYKSKGLISNEFPNLTLLQLRENLQNFVTNILNTFTKQNLTPLTDIQIYQNNVNEYLSVIYNYSGDNSWKNKYLDTKNYYVLKTGEKIYTFKSEILQGNQGLQKKTNAISELNGQIDNYNKLLKSNDTLGTNGTYTIDGKTKESSINFDITYSKFIVTPINNDIDFVETYRQIKNVKTIPSDDELQKFSNDLQSKNLFNSLTIYDKDGKKTPTQEFYIFEGKGRFLDIINTINVSIGKQDEQIKTDLTNALSTILKSKSKNGIGFVPTIRNVLAVFFANAEGFLRLMDDVHTKAWNVRDESIRKNIVFSQNVSQASQDNVGNGEKTNLPVYPWPQIIKETMGENGHEKFELRYPADDDMIGLTKAYRYDIWPEVEFVEEFLRGLTQKTVANNQPTTNDNELTDIKVSSVDAIEYPITNSVYLNKEEVKFFYEIYERVFLSSNYTRLIRSNVSVPDTDNISNIIATTEMNNITSMLGNDNVYLIKKLQEFNIRSSNIEALLKHISNDGTGESWQNFIRGIFNTSYIKNNVNNYSFGLINQDIINSQTSQPLVSMEKESDFINYISQSTNTNEYDFLDIYPFTNLTWDKTYLSNGYGIQNAKDSFDTRKTITYNPNQKVISNFLGNEQIDTKRPITNFIYKQSFIPTGYESDLKSFYGNRSYDTQLITEGNLRYYNYSGLVTNEQTTSILNTPFFINAIQEGVENFKNNEDYPFKSAAYLFINSLPLSTLREKFKTYDAIGSFDGTTSDLDYIFASLKKFGAIHKLPYPWILKIGSIWHRYKTFVNTNVDIINTSWSGFNSTVNYDPITHSPEKDYNLTVNGGNIDFVLEKNTSLGNESYSLMNVGFYPKLINDFNIFYQGFELYSNYTESEIQNSINSGLTLNYNPNAVIDMGKGFDNNNQGRSLRVIPWSIYLTPKNQSYSYVFPSEGSLINQTKNECILNDKLKFEITGNTSMYDGSVRLFWVAPNYGYFDTNKLVKPSPEQYMKEVFSIKGNTKQENFSINGAQTSYTKISEIFSVFEKNILDTFETAFLNFSKSKYNMDESITSNNLISTISDSTVNSSKLDSNTIKSFKNFHMMMGEMMKIPTPTGTTNVTIIEDIQKKQMVNVSNMLSGFLNYDIVFKYGNPSNFDKKLFYSFSTNQMIVDPYVFEKYTLKTPNALPPQINLINSQINNQNAWNALKTYVGFSEIPELEYKDSGSYITDFFIDMNIGFTVNNIINLSPIIKIYATQKLIDKNLNKDKFTDLMNSYLTKTNNFNNNIINNLMLLLNKAWGSVDFTPQPKLNTVLTANPIKVEYWESFKALNDKWISGNDFKNKTLFEDVLILDRASRNIGDKILADVYKLKDLLTNIEDNLKLSTLSLIQRFLTDNHFQVNNVPSYVNFYNVQDAVKNPTPKPDSAEVMANNLFGTFMNVDYRDSSAKLVCFYAGKPSTQLATNFNSDNRKDDSWDFSKKNSPLEENQNGKTDWDKSNKVCGFNVDIGPQNQSIFQSFSVTQNAGLSTAESIQAENNLASQRELKQSSTQSNSLYNLYKSRSYICSLQMLGNAMIQPTMYFNLKHVPMFSGPYMITKVSHNIGPGTFNTTVDGIRQSMASLPSIDNYVQSLKVNLLNSVKSELDKQLKQDKITTSNTKSVNNNVINQKNEVQNSSNGSESTKINNTQVCSANTQYDNYTPISTPKQSTENIKTVVDTIVSLTNDKKLQYVVFATLFLSSGNENGFISYENNYSGVDVRQYWGQSSDYFTKNNQYYCSENNTPFAIFDDLTNCVLFLVERWKGRMGLINNINSIDITKFWVLNSNTNKMRENNVYDTYDPIQLKNIETTVDSAIKIFSTTIGNLSGTP